MGRDAGGLMHYLDEEEWENDPVVNEPHIPIKPKYHFLIYHGREGGYEVRVTTLNYNYGEDYADFGEVLAANHPRLRNYFQETYATVGDAKAAIRRYRGNDKAVWEEPIDD